MSKNVNVNTPQLPVPERLRQSADAEFWRDCEREWGRGSGHRDRVNRRNQHWFETKGGKDADRRVQTVIHVVKARGKGTSPLI